jgi:hypothetical protein
MAQHDYILANAAGASFRADANNALAAIVSQNSGPNQPNETYAFQFWAHTAEGLLKQRNAANDGWIPLFRLDGAFSLIPPADGSVTTAKLADGVLAASTPGRAKMADEFVTQAKLAPAVQALLLTDGSVTTAKLVDAAVTPAKLSQPLTRATAIAATSGTSIDFTSIPSWVRRITVMLNGVSTNGTSFMQIQLGDSGGVETSGYFGGTGGIQGTNACTYLSSSTGFVIPGSTAGALRAGILSLVNLNTTNTWVASGTFDDGASFAGLTQGAKILSATLDRIRLTSVNGTDAFDAGEINIIYEG